MEDDLNRQTIMIVDDMPINIQVLARALKEDYHVKVATTGAKALEIATTQEPPDLIMLDIMMPVMDGYEVCKKLKNNPLTKDIPVIFITAKSEMEDEMLGLNLGAVDYITKPFLLPIVKTRVRTHLTLKRKGDILERLASIDPLTEIPNRRRIEDVLRTEWNRARQVHSVSVFMIDIDYFKKFNDHYGHLAGDDCLRNVARSLHTTISRSGDFIGRYGGEEFVVVLAETDLEGAVTVAEKLRCQVESLNIPHILSETAEVVTVSIGGAVTIPQNDLSPLALLQKADENLYEAKNRGRNRSEVRKI